MFYTFTTSVLTTHIAADPSIEELKLTSGVIHQVDILFEDGCNHEVHVQIFRGSHQLWPSNRGASIVGNATVVSFREFEELIPGDNVLTTRIWGDGVVDAKEVSIQIGLLPKTILQPMSFEALLKAALSK